MPTNPLSTPLADGHWVLHLVPPNGGGVDRFVRDLWQHRTADRVLHVTPDQWVLEETDGQFSPLEPDAQALLAALGRPGWVHAHAVEPAVRDAATRLCTSCQAPLALTLHDITFTFGDTQEQAARLAFVAQAALLTAPSQYIAATLLDQARRFQAPLLPTCQVIPNGSDTEPDAPAPSAGTDPTPTFDVAVVGAVGAHKGLDHLLHTIAAATPDLKVVVLGYVDGQLTPGWHVADRLWVHGAFEPAQLKRLLARYRVRRVWFPSGQPESFSYALSDVWQAGWPVLVPDHGALGERVRAHGRPADQCYPPDLPPVATASLLENLLSTDPTPDGSAAPVPGAIISTAAMARSYAALYASAAASRALADSLPAALPPSEHLSNIDLRHLAQQHLDGRFFRQELLRVQGESLAQQRQLENCRQELHDLARAHQARGEWITKLEGDNAHLKTTVGQLQVELNRPLWRIGISRLRSTCKKILEKFGQP